MRDCRDGSPHDSRDRPWKPADADVLIWTSCEKGGGIDGNCSPAAANNWGAARGEAGAAAGGGEAGKAQYERRTFVPVLGEPLFPP